MKKLLRSCLLLCLCAWLLPCALGEEWNGYPNGYVLCETLTLRESPDVTAPAMTTLTYGEQPTIIEEEEGWYQVVSSIRDPQTGMIVGRMQGWVRAEYLLESPAFFRQSSVTQELQPQDWGEPPEELLAQRICPRITGSQPVGSRLLAKGEARICLLYRTQDGSLHTWEGTLPFSCLLDGLTVPEEAQVTVTGSCGTARLIRSDGAAAIGVELTLSLLVRTYETVTVAPVTDLYSTRWDTALQRQSLTLTETWPPETVQPEVHQELESRPFLYVTAADCGAVTTGQEGDHTTLRTPLRLRLLYLDESGAPVTAERTDEAAAPVPGDVTTARAACLSPGLRPSGTGLELTVPVELTVERSRRCTWDAITAAELTEPEPGRRPSLVLCRPKKGESLWELAKRYRTDEQAICAANGLEQETPLPSGLLLIPRVR